MEHWQQLRARAAQREQQKRGAVDGQNYLATIAAVNNQSERVTVNYYGGSRTVRLLHPYEGFGAWMRAMPERGQAVLMSERIDTHEPEITRYYSTQVVQGSEPGSSQSGTSNTTNPRIQGYETGQDLYRPLNLGELEIASKGTVQTYYSERSIKDERAGVIKRWLNQDELESGAKSPLHRRVLHFNKSNAIGDEERLGVVKRPDNSNYKSKFIKSGTGFAKEWLLSLATGVGSPSKLVDIRAGNVADDKGEFINSGDTGNSLRYLARYYTDNGQNAYFSVDNRGNFVGALPYTASFGGMVKIPSGDLQVQVGNSLNFTVAQQFSALANNFTFLPGASLLGGSFSIGANASEPMVLGNQLVMLLTQMMNMFLGHFHIGNMGAPTPLDPASMVLAQVLLQSFLTIPLPTRPLILSENCQISGKIS
jgi:hypothetical protein